MPRHLPVAIASVLISLLTLVPSTTSASPPPPALHQQPASTPDWENLGLSGPAWRIFTPTSGALLIRTPSDLIRSDDGGTTWTPVPLPLRRTDRESWTIEVDPTDHTRLFASGSDGMSQSTDGGQSWTLVLPTDERTRAIAISPANPDLVYLGLDRPDSPGAFRFLRSRDGGASWDVLEQHQYTSCGWSIPIVLPHPSDEQRLLRAANCFSGANFYDQLRQSDDQGATWTTVFGVGLPGVSSRDSRQPQYAYPTNLVGGQGADPGRYYLATRRDSRIGNGASVFRGDIETRAWTEIIASRPATEPDGAILRVGGLAYHPAHPDTVYDGQMFYAPPQDSGLPKFIRAGVVASTDGGASWSELGRQDLPEIFDLALSLDGRALYLADREGLRRLPLN